MTIEVISDLHGNLIEVQPFDLLLICGDICPTSNHSNSFQEEWLQTIFCDWLLHLPYKDDWSRVLFIAGNHDFWFAQNGHNAIKLHTTIYNKCNREIGDRVKYLHNELEEYHYLSNAGVETINIFGTPYCKIFGHWAFMETEDALRKHYFKIPEEVDILISHDAPKNYNGLGCITEGHPAYHKDVGNPILTETLDWVKPRYYFCGHIHSGNHNFSYDKETWSANVSICNEVYDPIQEPLVFEYKTKENE